MQCTLQRVGDRIPESWRKFSIYGPHVYIPYPLRKKKDFEPALDLLGQSMQRHVEIAACQEW
jgi:hypothetical protein